MKGVNCEEPWRWNLPNSIGLPTLPLISSGGMLIDMEMKLELKRSSESEKFSPTHVDETWRMRASQHLLSSLDRRPWSLDTGSTEIYPFYRVKRKMTFPTYNFFTCCGCVRGMGFVKPVELIQSQASEALYIFYFAAFDTLTCIVRFDRLFQNS